MTTHTTYFQRPNGDEPDIEIEVEFTLTGGHGGSAPSLTDPGEPPEGPEFEVVSAAFDDGSDAGLTPEEEAKVMADVFDRLGDFDSGDDYYDDY